MPKSTKELKIGWLRLKKEWKLKKCTKVKGKVVEKRKKSLKGKRRIGFVDGVKNWESYCKLKVSLTNSTWQQVNFTTCYPIGSVITFDIVLSLGQIYTYYEQVAV